METEKTYIALDLKSFYASVECIQRDLDPLTAHLVVADESRTEKTICLAVSPALKQYGVSGRARLFEVVQQVKTVNARRLSKAPGHAFTGASHDDTQLKAHPELALDYLVAPPRMALYMETSAAIYDIYLKYAAPEDIHVYSIDEVFIDATAYLRAGGLTGEEYARKIILEVLSRTGITATAGVGSNLYLCKVAMDIVAKRIPADKNGVRIARLDEQSYRRQLWTHRPLTDFWRVGQGYAKKLEDHGLFTMGDVARCSLDNEELLYRLFGVQAELLIDHAWGWEGCSLADIKAYRPSTNSISSGQVLHSPYTAEKARLIVREMTDLLALDLVEKGLVTDQLVLTVGYDIDNLTDGRSYSGPVTTDHYGRRIPKHAHGTLNLSGFTSSTKELLQGVSALYDRIVDPSLLVRRMYVVANRVIREEDVPAPSEGEQMDLFTDYESLDAQNAREAADRQREKRRQQAILAVKHKYGKNSLVKGMNLEEGATAMDRNAQIGGHKA